MVPDTHSTGESESGLPGLAGGRSWIVRNETRKRWCARSLQPIQSALFRLLFRFVTAIPSIRTSADAWHALIFSCSKFPPWSHAGWPSCLNRLVLAQRLMALRSISPAIASTSDTGGSLSVNSSLVGRPAVHDVRKLPVVATLCSKHRAKDGFPASAKVVCHAH